jgi:LemA protein
MRETRASVISAGDATEAGGRDPAARIGSPAMVWVIVVLLVIAALIVLALIALYNRFVRLRNRVDNSWAQIEVQLKRRWDLIPNLVETVRGYAEHERGTFEAVTEARANAQRAQGPAETAAAEGILGQALGRLFAVAEAYPELQADENFRQLQTELSETENRIAVSRQVYNDTVLTYNNAIQTFPGVVLAGPFGFAKREFFETDETQREAPRVDFSPGSGPAAPSVSPPAAQATPSADAPSEPPAS